MSDWRYRARCRTGYDPNTWFPAGMTGPFALQTEHAKSICRHCPVVQECRAFALETRQTDGVWGGTDADERRRILKATDQRGFRLRVMDGRLLAIDHGVRLLTLLAEGAGETRMRAELGCSTGVLRQALRLLVPERVPQRSASATTALERALWDAGELRCLRDSGATVAEMGRDPIVSYDEATIRDALEILQVRDAFLASHTRMEAAA